jgi:serine phosphatase RsbU (regulator of sigma subunit)
LDQEEKLRRTILVRVILLTAIFGSVWSVLYFFLKLNGGGMVVLSYAILSFFNLFMFYATRKYRPFRMVQLILILLLPTGTQIALGGFYSASNVVLAAILCPLGALMFYNIRVARVLFIFFLAAVVLVAVLEFLFPGRAAHVDQSIVLMFFTMNTLVISSIVFALLVYFVAQRALFQKMLAEKNKDLTDSIQYAKRIQDAILPPKRYMMKHFPDSFILYKPKDIVAGDFYFFETFDDYAFIAAADCTGHGVPGAMVSVVCSNALNRVIKEFQLTDPGLILDKVRDIVIETFSQNEKHAGEHHDFVRDGMDISLAVIHTKTNELKWAGANNGLYLLRDSEQLLDDFENIRVYDLPEDMDEEKDILMAELEPNKQPIGNFIHREPFRTIKVNLQKGDCVYLFTDGYQDQFGGERGKKFKAENIRRMLLKLFRKPMDQQSLRIEEMFYQWKGDIEQIDDVCFMGIRI